MVWFSCGQTLAGTICCLLGLVGLHHRISEMLTGKPDSLELIGKVTDRSEDSSQATWRLSVRISRSVVEGKGLPRSWHGHSFEKASDPA